MCANAGNLKDAGSIRGREGSLEEGMITHSSILAWRIPWTEEAGGLQSIGSQRVEHHWSAFACMREAHQRQAGSGQPTPHLTRPCPSELAHCFPSAALGVEISRIAGKPVPASPGTINPGPPALWPPGTYNHCTHRLCTVLPAAPGTFRWHLLTLVAGGGRQGVPPESSLSGSLTPEVRVWGPEPAPAPSRSV